GAFIVRVELADLNGDGRQDVVALDRGAGSGNGAVVVCRALAGGGFADPVAYPINGQPISIAIAHVDADATLDVVVATASSVEVRFGDGAGGFSAPVPSFSPIGLQRLAAADVTGDGLADVVYAVSYNDGAGYFHEGTGLWAGDGTGHFPIHLASSD